MAKFKVGDRVRVIFNPKYRYVENGAASFVGQVGEVAGITPRGIIILDPPLITPERIAEGILGWKEDSLELMPPDKEQTISWKRCVWKPASMRV